MAVSLQNGAPFRMLGLRQFQTEPGVAASFPIGYPLLLAASELLLPVGARIGVLVNALLVIAAARVAEHAGRRAGVVGLGPAIVLAVAVWPPFAQEIAAGRSFPLALLVVLALFATLTKQDTSYRWALAGLLVGGGGVVRFDLLPVAGLVVALSWCMEENRRWKNLATAGSVAAAIVILNLLAGAIATGELLRSDNVRTVVAVTDVYVRDFLPIPPPTVFNDPVAWGARLVSNAGIALRSFLKAAILAFPSVAVVIFAAPRGYGKPSLSRSAIAVAIATFVGASFGILATGYGDTRYWALTVGASALVGSIRLAEVSLKPGAAHRREALVAATTLLVVVLHLGWTLVGGRFLGERAHISNPLDGMRQCLAAGDRVMWEDSQPALHVSAVARVKTSVLPSNLSDLTAEEQEALVTDFGVTHVRNVPQITEHLRLPTQPTACSEKLLEVRTLSAG